jgi:UDP-glucose 4-epimerase
MKIAVLGATGNHGSSLVRRLSRDPEVEAITGIARRRPRLDVPKG